MPRRLRDGGVNDVMEEVANGHADGWAEKLKTPVIQAAPPFAGMGGVLFLLDVLGVFWLKTIV